MQSRKAMLHLEDVKTFAMNGNVGVRMAKARILSTILFSRSS